MQYSHLAKWSVALKVFTAALSSLAILLRLFPDLQPPSPSSLPSILYGSLGLLLFFLLSLASIKHSLKAYGLALSLWTILTVQVLLFPTLLSNLQGAPLTLGADLFLIIFSITSILLLYTSNVGWKGLFASIPLYLIALGALSFLYLGYNGFLTLLYSLKAGNLTAIPFPQELSSQGGRLWFLSGTLLLLGYVFLSSPHYQKPYSSLKSVGLTFPSIPVLSVPLLLFLGSPPFPTILNLLSLITVPLSLLRWVKGRPLQFGLSVSSASLVLSLLLLILGSPEALIFTASAGSVIPRGLTDPDKVKTKLVEAIKNGRYAQAKKFVDFLKDVGVTPSQLLCEASRNKNCTLALWLLERYQVNLDSCRDLKGVTDCIVYSGKIPTGVNQLLLSLQKVDRDSAEKLAGLVLAKSPDERTRDTARKVLASMTQSVKEELNLPQLSSWDPTLWVGRELYGYKVLKLVGKGGNAYVLLAERGGVQYAVKIPMLAPSSGGGTRASRLTFSDTAGESSKLQEISSKTEDMVTLYGVFVDQTAIREILSGKVETYLKSPPAIIMEFMGGGDVEGLLKEQQVVNSRKWQTIVALISLRVARALWVVHQEGYVHLDVKTKNVFFSSQPGRTGEEVLNNLLTGRVKAKLGDLGASRKVGDRLDQYTAEYCPVDQVEAMLTGKGANYKMDVYALGATMYKMLTLSSLNPLEVVRLMDGAVDQFVKRGDYRASLERAKVIYSNYYSSLSLPGVDPELTRVLKSLVHPDPNARPTAQQVVVELEKVVRRLEPRYSGG